MYTTERQKHAVNSGCWWGLKDHFNNIITECNCLKSDSLKAVKLCVTCNRRMIADKEDSSKYCIDHENVHARV